MVVGSSISRQSDVNAENVLSFAPDLEKVKEEKNQLHSHILYLALFRALTLVLDQTHTHTDATTF
jgi:hypothetical protein